MKTAEVVELRGCNIMLMSLAAWGLDQFNPVPDRKTLLKIAAEDGLNPTKKGGGWYVARKIEYKDLPKNLYFDGSRFRYRNPQTGERTWFPIETTKHEAVEASIHLNAKLAPPISLVARVMGTPNFSEFSGEWLKRQSTKSKSTRTQAKYTERALSKAFAGPITAVSLKNISDHLSKQTVHMQRHHRAALVEIYRIALARGAVEDNLPERTERIKNITKKRPRLTMEQYQTTHSQAPEWLQIAMDFALYSLQRQGDILKLKYEDIECGYIHLIQEKTKSPVKIAIGLKLQEVVSRSKRTDIHSRFIVHKRNRNFPMKTHIAKSVLQEGWRQAVKGIADPYPTFHEIRSLGITMYRDQGLDPQALAGHATERMTDNYDQEIRYEEAGTL